MGKKRFSMNLYQKFVTAMIIGGVLPMIILSTFILNQMFRNYETSLLDSYEQSLEYVSGSVNNLLDNYDEVLKLLYYYNDSNIATNSIHDDRIYSLKRILEIEANDLTSKKEAIRLRNEGMTNFVRYIGLTDPYISSTFFIDDKNNVYGYSSNSYFEDFEKLSNEINLLNINKASKEMQIYPTHHNNYFRMKNDLVFSLSRNYFDLAGIVGNYKYLGSLFIEIDMKSLDRMFSPTQIYKQGEVFILDKNDICIYSNNYDLISKEINNLNGGNSNTNDDLYTERRLNNGWRIIYKIPYNTIFSQLKSAQRIMIWILIITVVILFLSSFLFSKRMTRPIRNMMRQMEAIESGDFTMQIPVQSGDELGILSRRFNQMAKELDSYINKYYIAQIKQKEAELTALKSQIYPHFLYNTLEVIRMTAVSNDDMVVSDMIEALADQIHYVIGSTNDLVVLEKEIDIIKKYVFLLNCRIKGKINFTYDISDLSRFKIPQLILQPLVENAYLHGLKPKEGYGNICIIAEKVDNNVEIMVMDNGSGMDGDSLESVQKRLESNESEIKDTDTWHSIGMKNVHDRIRHLYGRPYGIEITSAIGIGTSVKLVIPLQKDEVIEDAENDYSR